MPSAWYSSMSAQRARHGGGGVEAQAGIDLGADAAGHGMMDRISAAKAHQQPVWMRQASGRTATFTAPGATAWRGVIDSGPSCTSPSAPASAGNSMASPMKPATNSLCGYSYISLRRAALRNQAVRAHHHDLVAHGQRLALVVGDIGHGQVEALLQAADFLAHLAAQARVQVAQRLVEQQHRGLQHQGPRQRHALLLAARELAGQALVVADQADVLQGLGRARGPPRAPRRTS
jgi:hypothetical protein